MGLVNISKQFSKMEEARPGETSNLLLGKETSDTHNSESETDAVFVEEEQSPGPSLANKRRNKCISAIACTWYAESALISSLLYGVEITYCIPLLLAINVSIQVTSFIFSISSILVLLVYTLTCTSCCFSFTKRKPVIFFIGLLASLGLGLMFLSFYLSQISSSSLTLPTSLPSTDNTTTLIIILAIVGFILLDYGMKQLQLSSRFHSCVRSLDTHLVTRDQSQRRLACAVEFGLGLVVIGTIASIDYKILVQEELTLFGKCGVVFVSASVLVLLIVIGCLFCNKDNAISSGGKQDQELLAHSVSERNRYSAYCSIVTFACSASKEFWVLSSAVFFSEMALFPFLIYMTSFVAEVLYDGVPQVFWVDAVTKDYAKGLRVGSWAITFGASLATVFFLTLSSKLQRVFGLKAVFVFIQFFFVLALFFLTYWTNIITVFIMCFLALLYHGVYITIPHIILSLYQVSIIIIMMIIGPIVVGTSASS